MLQAPRATDMYTYRGQMYLSSATGIAEEVSSAIQWMGAFHGNQSCQSASPSSMEVVEVTIHRRFNNPRRDETPCLMSVLLERRSLKAEKIRQRLTLQGLWWRLRGSEDG
ncbi:hypothetical protein FALCPG4_004815 [Fusarium falciforme]